MKSDFLAQTEMMNFQMISKLYDHSVLHSLIQFTAGATGKLFVTGIAITSIVPMLLLKQQNKLFGFGSFKIPAELNIVIHYPNSSLQSTNKALIE